MAEGNSISCEIMTACGVISERSGGWKKELNLVSWNGRKPRYDIRDWNPDHDRPGKGITLSLDELRQLGALINAEIRRVDEENRHPATDFSKEPAVEKNGQQAFQFTEAKPANINGAVDYDEL